MIRFTLLLFGVLAGVIAAPPDAFAWKRNPCNDPRATCQDQGGNRMCGYPGESFSVCRTSHDIQLPPQKKSPDRATVAEYVNKKREECMQDVARQRARDGADGFASVIDATKAAGCKLVK